MGDARKEFCLLIFDKRSNMAGMRTQIIELIFGPEHLKFGAFSGRPRSLSDMLGVIFSISEFHHLQKLAQSCILGVI